MTAHSLDSLILRALRESAVHLTSGDLCSGTIGEGGHLAFGEGGFVRSVGRGGIDFVGDDESIA